MWGAVGLSHIWPAHRSVQHAQYLKDATSDPVGDNVWSTADDQLAGVGNAARPPEIRVIGELLYRIDNS